MWTQRAHRAVSPGRLCVKVWKLSTQEVLGVADYELPEWPQAPTQLAIAFDLDHAALAAGDRLMVSLFTHAGSGDDLVVHYDHPAYQSALTVAMATGHELP
jgi:hypothetical protein